jgi:septum formation topological specificity factor MinE
MNIIINRTKIEIMSYAVVTKYVKWSEEYVNVHTEE